MRTHALAAMDKTMPVFLAIALSPRTIVAAIRIVPALIAKIMAVADAHMDNALEWWIG